VGDTPYPRCNPTDTARLPADVWQAATVPIGVRLELVGDAQAIDVAYRTTSGNLGYRGDGAGITFSVWRGSRKACEEEAVLGDGLIRLSLGSGSADKPAIIYLPEGMHPIIRSLTAVKGEISPAAELPRWIAYGDWTTQGWTASGPSQGWTAIAARKTGLDLVNFGYAGAARGEIVSAEHISTLPAAVITIAYGASCWTRVPASVGMVTEGLRAFLDVVRQGHPTTPIVVISPILRPDAEDAPNRLGATMADIRHTMETVTRERIVAGDATLSLVAGESIISADHLVDGIHPGDEGHKRIASAVAKALGAAMRPTADDPALATLVDEALLIGGRNGLVRRDSVAGDRVGGDSHATGVVADGADGADGTAHGADSADGTADGTDGTADATAGADAADGTADWAAADGTPVSDGTWDPEATWDAGVVEPAEVTEDEVSTDGGGMIDDGDIIDHGGDPGGMDEVVEAGDEVGDDGLDVTAAPSML
jgi:lysophospholipase L1-like esterase